MRRSIVAAFVMMSVGWPVAAADDFPYPPTQTFIATRNGQPIGSHTLSFTTDGTQRTVTVSIDLALKVVGVTAYRYAHRSTEVWNGDRLHSLASDTDDNGRRHMVNARRSGDKLAVEREEIPLALPATNADQGLPRTLSVKEVLPGDLQPSSHWNVRQTTLSALLNTQAGTQASIVVTPLGRDSVRTSKRTVEATRYRYTGDIRMEQWFDDRGRWVKSSFVAPDNSTIEYILQE